MYDIKKVKDMIKHGGIALNESLEKRIMNDEMTESDHSFLSKNIGLMRDFNKEDYRNKLYSSTPWLVALVDGKAMTSADKEDIRLYCKLSGYEILVSGMNYDEAKKFEGDYNSNGGIGENDQH